MRGAGEDAVGADGAAAAGTGMAELGGGATGTGD